MSKFLSSLVGIVCTFSILATQAVAQAPAQPGPEHEILKKMEGSWSCILKAGEEQSKCSATIKSILGGLWLATEFKGDLGGATFEGRGLDGYDLDKKKYVSVWVDSMTSSIMTFEGTYDESSKTLSMRAEGKGPDGNPAKYKTTTTMPDKDHHVFKMFLVGPDGGDNLMMTIEYTRQKK